eukprot:scaffold23126_cov241-Isochrysis_galbana.AAC.14
MRDFRMVALALIFTVAMELDMANHQAGQGKQNSAHAVERTMAPRQLFTQPMEDENDPEPGSKRVRPSSTDEGSMQVRLRARASA